MKKTLTLIVGGLLAASLGVAQAADHAAAKAEAWTPGALQKALAGMPKGDATRGKTLNTQLMCASCHGDVGLAPTHNWPHTAGQRAEYTYKMLLDYKSGLRNDGERARLMNTVAAIMSEQDMADVAAYYAAQPLPAPLPQSLPADVYAKTDALVRQGDPTRLITPCAACHGLHGQGGFNETPALAGQNPQAFIRTMQAYKDGSRHNDTNKGMAQFAERLTNEEIEHLAAYYASQVAPAK
ncbi:MAG: c-type cytochrome [Halothiobacillaceae bacterium]|jgi:cytochrome c553|nr:c-type cytochrome [Halothiobacillaceae bacterium]MDY0049553.1 c-type cytochrome [Halothiobacillaceae bacterium]